MDAFRAHGKAAATLESKLDEARDAVNKLKAAGIDLNDVGEELQTGRRRAVQEIVRGFAGRDPEASRSDSGRRAGAPAK